MQNFLETSLQPNEVSIFWDYNEVTIFVFSDILCTRIYVVIKLKNFTGSDMGNI